MRDFYSGSCRLAEFAKNQASSCMVYQDLGKSESPRVPHSHANYGKVSRTAISQITPYHSHPAMSILKPNTLLPNLSNTVRDLASEWPPRQSDFSCFCQTCTRICQLYTCWCFFLSFRVGVSWVFIQLRDGEKLQGLSASVCGRWGRRWCRLIRKNVLVRREKHGETEVLERLSVGNVPGQPCQALMCLDLSLKGKVARRQVPGICSAV